MSLKRYKDQTLLNRLEKYDAKYYDLIMTPRESESFGYSMRAYHRNKVSNPPEFKIAKKAELIAEELRERNVFFRTSYLKLKFNTI